MKFIATVAFVFLIATGFAACSRRGSSDFVKRSIVVDLPPDWHEEPGQLPRTYRRDGDQSGYLQISLQPPLPRPVTSAEQAEEELRTLLDSLGMELGERLLLSHTESSVGIIAFALHKSPEKGLLQFWLIPSDVTVFATYTMGNLATAKQEIGEAHEIMKKLRWE